MSKRIFSKSFSSRSSVTPFAWGQCLLLNLVLELLGLDYWYPDDDFFQSVDESEFKIFDNRLSRRLGVNHFRLPPDYKKILFHKDSVNMHLTVPALRFPSWHMHKN